MAMHSITIEAFGSALRTIYVEDPSGVLPNALWKTLREISSCQRHLQGSADRPSEIALWDDQRLLVSWSRSGRPAAPVSEALGRVQLALIHERTLVHCRTERFKVRDAHVRMHLPLADLSAPGLARSLRAVPARLPEEIDVISAFISNCYEDLSPSPETVLGWTVHKTFEPRLWIWIEETRTGGRLALGVAEHDSSTGEVSLEWIQVHPGARRQGIGQALVLQILRRACGIGRFATVSGLAGTPAEKLYRSCGFRAPNIWWCLRT